VGSLTLRFICSYTKSGEVACDPAKPAKTLKDRVIDLTEGTRERGTDLLFKVGRRG
jgi:hypothetical protein